VAVKKRLSFLILILLGLAILTYRSFNSDDYHLFIKPDVGGHGHGYLYYDDGLSTRRVYIGEEAESGLYRADLSPDGSRIAFTKNAYVDIFDLKADRLIQINATSETLFVNTTIQWSPDGSKIGFPCSRAYEQPPEVCVWDLGKAELQILTDLRSYGEYANLMFGGWSADGKTIAFSLVYYEDDAGISRQVILKLDTLTGTLSTVLDIQHAGTNKNFDIALSPDGRTILFSGSSPLEVQEQDTTDALYRINSDGSGLQRLLDSDRWLFFQPVWSTDGRSFFVNSSDYYHLIPLQYDLSGRLIRRLPFQSGRIMLSWRSARPNSK
jgi:Tol biopolymer transport system component